MGHLFILTHFPALLLYVPNYYVLLTTFEKSKWQHLLECVTAALLTKPEFLLQLSKSTAVFTPASKKVCFSIFSPLKNLNTQTYGKIRLVQYINIS